MDGEVEGGSLIRLYSPERLTSLLFGHSGILCGLDCFMRCIKCQVLLRYPLYSDSFSSSLSQGIGLRSNGSLAMLGVALPVCFRLPVLLPNWWRK
jgi:hypothetical protein